MLVIGVNAKNDINGNPQRLYILVGDDGHMKAIAPDDYRGEPKEWAQLPILHFNVAVKEYKRYLKIGELLDIIVKP